MPETNNNNLILGCLAACAAGVVGFGLLYYTVFRRSRRQYAPVGVVSRIFVHPIKSCRGLEVTEADCVSLGISSDGVLDRSFIIVDEEGRFITQRVYPSIALIIPTLSEDRRSLLINAPGMPTLQVPLAEQGGAVGDVRVFRLGLKGEDCGQEARQWLNQYLGEPRFRLMRHLDRLGGKVLCDDSKWGHKAKSHERAVYQNLSQVHILSEKSLEQLNSQLEKPVQLRNFRPNIVVQCATANEEDKWKYVRIGDSALMRITHKCGRCIQTTVDQDKGKFIQNGDPLATLKKVRMAPPDNPDRETHGSAPIFGVLLAVESTGVIRLGDVIYASVD
ncbi:mitochondrial amidoxime reducing component 2-like [Diadema antillarum]|uniref:mitochondrial amidoxime reducing component 2-like n=1 Tax=Diadema antillarum TaxID=105358 RepID=UPI003A8A4B17